MANGMMPEDGTWAAITMQLGRIEAFQQSFREDMKAVRDTMQQIDVRVRHLETRQAAFAGIAEDEERQTTWSLSKKSMAGAWIGAALLFATSVASIVVTIIYHK